MADHVLLVEEPSRDSIVFFEHRPKKPEDELSPYSVYATWNAAAERWCTRGRVGGYTWAELVAKARPGSIEVAPLAAFRAVRPVPAEPADGALVSVVDVGGSVSWWGRSGGLWRRLAPAGSSVAWVDVIANSPVGAVRVQLPGELLA